MTKAGSKGTFQSFALADAGVLVVPGDCFGAPEHMRIGFGAQVEGFDKAAAIFRNAIIRAEDHSA